MTAPPYFPLTLPVAARASDELGLAELLTAEAPELFRLRQVAARLRERSGDGQVSGARLNLLRQQNRIFTWLARRHFAAHRARCVTAHLEVDGVPHPVPTLAPALFAFTALFPPSGAPRALEAPQWFAGRSGKRRSQAALAELYVLAVQNENRAAAAFRPLFADGELRAASAYPGLLGELDALLLTTEAGGLFALPLCELLRLPLRAAPDSLEGQLRYIRTHWGSVLPTELLEELLIALDLFDEEERPHGGGGPGPLQVPSFDAGSWEEPVRFSPDTDWMPHVVLLAKTIYVWLDQLGKRYGTPIERLDQIPDAELDRIARWGFTSLWLIGIWERSAASAEIKRRMGNSEAVASAYSLYDYAVSGDLGGEAALDILAARCRERGIRLACDVVPNHTGIDSRWTREHPDWFVQVDHPPYPAYQFSGPDLSQAHGISLRIEDGYWRHSDAAVVFQRIEHGSGKVRYIYHGNDGTHLPWNDTAQLNFLLPEVREAMIQLIVAVARRFPVIRFDAAMTLAKKHYQRLWFPQPGGGAGVPSRAAHAMSRADFERVFPVEFWREVVDRVAREVPDTLLLAEAFWLMEGYFVRTLGMHRVYNSSFMNMLKTEENAKYRGVLKEILAFEPEILKRFVNFMNNPDEETAVAQFGKSDKYFGVAVMLATLPGLPMFGHGQIEGFEEKYGMEYRRAYRDEAPDAGFIAHHEHQICPLLRRRRLFSGSADFVLYDLQAGGHVNEDVYAYSNRCGDERALVVVHNRFAEVTGTIHWAAAKRGSMATTLAAGLGLEDGEQTFYRFRDLHSGLTWLRHAPQLCRDGLAVSLGPYGYHVFVDFTPLFDHDGCWRTLCDRLGGAPVADLEREWLLLRHAGLHAVLRQLLPLPRLVALACGDAWDAAAFAAELGPLQERLGLADSGHRHRSAAAVRDQLADLHKVLRGRSRSLTLARALLRPLFAEPAPQGPPPLAQLLPWLLLCPEGEVAGPWAGRLLLEEPLTALFAGGVQPPAEPQLCACLTLLLLDHAGFAAPGRGLRDDFLALLADSVAQAFLGCNDYEGATWFNRERAELLLDWLAALLALRAPEWPAAELAAAADALVRWRQAAEASGFRMAIWREMI